MNPARRASAWRWLKRAAWAACGCVVATWCAERVVDVSWPYPLARLQAMPCSTVLTAVDGTWLRVAPTPAGERALPLAWDECAPSLQAAILVGEDERFFDHGGVDWCAGVRAFASNVAAGRVVSGASTLTMQVVRMVEPRPRTFAAKALEVVRARQLERVLDKQQIAAVWLTQVPMGGTLRGMEAAARHWFGRSARELDTAAAAVLVAMVPAPSARSPERRPELLRARRDALLRRMHERGHLDAAALAAALATDLGMQRQPWPWCAPHACDGALAELGAGERPAVLAVGIDLELQQRVQRVVNEQPDLPGDGLAVVVVRRDDGSLPVVLGDRDPLAPLDLSRCRRSAGSTWKPFLYALARERGAVAAQGFVDDLPRAFDDWRPANFDRGWLGRTRAGDALATSSNLAAVRCLETVGTAPFAELLRELGLYDGERPLHLDAALGTSPVSPRRLAQAYWRFVERPEDVGLSRASVQWTLQSLRRLPLVAGQTRAGDVAWKSGTSSGRRDAWCVGITDEHVVVVWLGNRDGRGLPDLVGVRIANRLLAAVLSVVAPE